ncbi:MAG: tRNA (N(6)-L-threonylcarbamoyladenosine(37)-C(2))-methylthiotransferase [Candidatus Methanosuratincola sp.]|nr:tRNA (N(6)-L-threonylcarbamoyladenosine(37)-C(2))-methylthiotransferase [Candidatus Methanosuratincola sp.]
MRVFIKTFGCELNRADSEVIAAQLQGSSIGIADSEEAADAVVVNTCTVRGETESKVLQYISSIRNKMIVATGCMAAAQPGLLSCTCPEISIVTLNNLRDLARALRERVISVKRGGECPTPAPFTRGVVHTIPISRGCIGECSYCIVRLARGKLLSTPPEEILRIAECAASSGALEIRLAAQDAGAYGLDLGCSLSALLRRVAALPYDFRIRVGMFNLSSVWAILDELMDCYASKKIYKFAHMPLQSGSDRILSLMRRGYTVGMYLDAVRRMRNRFPEMSLATDIIVGYPGETEADFKETCEALESVVPDKIHVSRFAPRPHTPAALAEQVPETVKKTRSRILAKKKIEIQTSRNKKWVGKEVEATILASRKGIGAVARTDEYKPVLVKGAEPPALGSRHVLEITGCSPFSLVGEVIRR